MFVDCLLVSDQNQVSALVVDLVVTVAFRLFVRVLSDDLEPIQSEVCFSPADLL